jgi:hypothetical protein
MIGASWRATRARYRSSTSVRVRSRSFDAGLRLGTSAGRTLLRTDGALRTGALIATFSRAAPPRCGAFADGWRIVTGDGGGRVSHRRACASLVASFAAGVREAGTQTDNALFMPACSIANSLALRPRAAARSQMSGESWMGERRRKVLRSPVHSYQYVAEVLTYLWAEKM